MKKKSYRAFFPHLKENFDYLIKITKIVVLILIAGISSVFADASYSQNKFFTFHLKNGTIKQVFDQIQKESEFIIFYKDDQVDLNKKLDINAEKATVEQVLDQALANTKLTYEVIDRQIVVLPEQKPAAKQSPRKINNGTTTTKKRYFGYCKGFKGTAFARGGGNDKRHHYRCYY